MPLGPQVLVELKFAEGIDIEGIFRCALFAKATGHAIHRGARGIEERYPVFLTPMEQGLAVGVVVVHDIATITGHGVGTGALMKDGVDLPQTARKQFGQKGLGLEIIANVEIGEVAKLVGTLQMITDQNVRDPSLIEGVYEIGTDESSTASNDIHGIGHLLCAMIAKTLLEGAMPDHSLLTVVVLLAAAVLTVAAARKVRLPPIISYLLMGMLLGPHALALVPDEERMRHLAEFGVVFLMFSIGLEFSLAQFIRMRRLVFGLGSAQVVLTAITFLGVALLIPLSWRTGVVLGGILAMSSTAMVVRALADRLETQSRHGRIAISILLFQDLAVIPLLILIPALAGSPRELPHDLAIAGAKAVLALLLLVVIGRPLVSPWFEWVAARKSNELFMLNLLLVTLGLAWITEAAGLSLALGAFIAGMLLAETAYRYQVEADIASFRDILLGLFFVTIGMMVDVPVLIEYLPWVLLVLVLIFFLKGGLVWIICRVTGFENGVALRSAVVLAQAGEFGFVLISLASQKNLLPPGVLQPVLGAMLLSMLFAPVLVQYNGAIARLLAPGYRNRRQQDLEEVRQQDLREHVIICGYGRVGQSIARVLEDEGVPYLALDLDPTRVRQAQAAGETIFYGDASRRDLLEAAGIGHARAIVITYGNVQETARVLAVAKELRPQIPSVVRAHDDSQMAALEAAGADEVIPEVTEGALMLASQTLLQIGFPLSTVLRRVRRFRQERYSLFRGNFWGGSAPGEDQESPRLYSIALGETAYALGRRLGDLELEKRGVQVAAVRRFGIRGREPSPETRLRRGDVLVLFGSPESLTDSERFVLHGEQEEKDAKGVEAV